MADQSLCVGRVRVTSLEGVVFVMFISVEMTIWYRVRLALGLPLLKLAIRILGADVDTRIKA